MFVLNLDWFMATLLDRKDRMSMYSGLEVRVPFCDHRIVEYAYNMPVSYTHLSSVAPYANKLNAQQFLTASAL